MKTKILFICMVLFTMTNAIALPQGFVYLQDIDPSIITHLRYYDKENFIGKRITGYEKNVVVMTKEAALALSKAQKIFNQAGYNIVVYDSYRPQDSVDEFKRWSLDINDQAMKKQYYPRIDKAKFFELGYVSAKSGHTRGSTIDLSLINKGEALQEVKATPRRLKDGFEIQFLDDGTIDMGSSFDLMDEASHYDNDLISDEHKSRREYLKQVMAECGFESYAKEWWHFTLRNEPFPNDYFNFHIH